MQVRGARDGSTGSWNPYRRDCPTRQLLDRIGDQWTVLVIGCLISGTRRYSELAREIEGVSQKMLTQTLRALERDGIVERTVYPVVPPHVDYELTELGRTLHEPIRALESWSVRNIENVLASRARFDAEIGGAP